MATVDERIVSMKFNNKDFEQNAEKSIKTLDKLKSALKLDGAKKSFDGLKTASSNLNKELSSALNLVVNGVDAINKRFTILGKIGDNIKSQIAGALTSVATEAAKTVSALSPLTSMGSIVAQTAGLVSSSIQSMTPSANLAAGWQKFGDKTKAVQTIVAQGFGLDEVNSQMERLNWFTDETSYNFTDMVSEIGKFTATGQGLTESVTAMEGIALWAAASGQGAQKASQAMYQLSQAMGKGALRYDDWKSIQNASMDTKEFREQAVGAAEALGILKKTGEDTYKVLASGNEFSLSEMFASEALTKEKWFNKDVMMSVFQRYAEAVDQIYEYAEEKGITASEAIEELGGSIDALALKWFKAGQEARTFEDVIDSVKDAVSTGWMRTFELLFGNAEEATQVWTWWANNLWDAFAASGEARNEMLAGWKEMGGYQATIEGISWAWHGLANVLDIVKTAWEKVLEPINSTDLFNFSEDFKKGAEAFYKFFGDAYSDEYDALWDKAYKNGYVTTDQIINELDRRGGPAEARAKDLAATVEGLASALDLVKTVLVAIKSSFIDPVLDKLPDKITKVLDKTGEMGRNFKAFVDKLKASGEIEKKVQGIATWFSNAGKTISSAAKKVKEFLDKAKNLESVKTLMDKLSKVKLGVFDRLKGFFSTIKNVDLPLPSMETLLGIVDMLAGVVNKVISGFQFGAGIVKTFFDNLDLKKVKEDIQTFGDKIGEVISGILENKNLRESAKTAGQNILAGLKDALSEVDIWDALKNIGKGALIGKAVLNIASFFETITKSAKDVASIPSGVIELLTQVKDTLSAYQTELKTESIKNIAIAIVALVAAFWILSVIDEGAMANAVAAITLVGLVVALIVGMMAKLQEAKSKISAAQAAVEQARGVTSALQNLVNQIGGALRIVATELGEGLKKMLKSFGKAAIIGSIGAAFLMIAASVGVLVLAFKAFNDAFNKDPEGMTRAVIIMSGLALGIGVMVGMLTSMQKNTYAIAEVGSTFLKIAGAMVLIGLALKIVAGIKGDVVTAGLVMGGLAGVIAVLMLISNQIGGSEVSQMGTAFLKMAGSIAIMGVALRILASADPWSIVASMLAMSVTLIAMAKAMQMISQIDASSAAKAMLQATLAVIAIAAAAAIITKSGASFKQVGVLLLAFAGAMAVFLGASWVAGLPGIAQGMIVLSTAVEKLGIAVLAAGVGVLALGAGMKLLEGISPDRIANIFTGLAQGLINFMEVILANLPTVIKFAGVLVAGIAAGILAKKALVALAGVETMAEFIKGVVQALPTLGPLVLTGLGLLLGMILEWLGVKIGPLIQTIVKLLIIVIDELSIALIDLAPRIVDAIGYLFLAVENAISSSIARIGRILITGIINMARPLLELFGVNVDDILAKVDGFFDVVDNTIGEQGDYIKGELTNEINEVRGSMGNDIDALTGDAETKFGQMGGKSGDAYNSALEERIGGADMQDAAIAEKLWSKNQAHQDGSERGSDFMTGMGEGLQSGAMGVLESVGKGFDRSSAVDYGHEYGSGYSEGVGDALDETSWSDYGIAIPEGIGEGIDGSSAAKDSATNMASGVDKAVTGMLGIASPSKVMESHGENVSIGFAQGIDANSYQATAEARSMAQGAATAANSQRQNFYNAGSYAGQGFVQGLRAWLSASTAAGRQIAANALDAARQRLNENSPSKEMRKVGSYAGQGFVIGLQSWVEKSALAGERIADKVYEALLDPIERVKQIASDEFEVNPVVRPVVDLTNLQNRSNLFGYGMGSVRLANADFSGVMANGRIMTDMQDTVAKLNNSISELSKARPEINVAVYAQPGQDPRAIANAAIDKITREILRPDSPWKK